MTRYIFSTAFALLALLMVFKYPGAMINPGDLLEGHQDIRNECFKCHEIFSGTPENRCTECHKYEKIDFYRVDGSRIIATQPRKFHHKGLKKSECVSCHTEHIGKSPKTSILSFSHNLLSDEQKQECRTCHAKPADSLHQLSIKNCLECHSTEKWKPASFDHDEFFRFDRHHDSRCESCHTGADYRSYTCYECHEHRRSKIRREHLEEGIREYERCEKCHRSGDEDEAKRIWKKMSKANPELIERNSKYRHSDEHGDDDDHHDDDDDEHDNDD